MTENNLIAMQRGKVHVSQHENLLVNLCGKTRRKKKSSNLNQIITVHVSSVQGHP